jgi:fibronectin type 3 domain-containing protein
VTVNSLNGFSSPVTLSVASESGFPGGITSGGFNPKSITGAGSSTLTMNTTTSANPYALSLTISGVSGTITHAAATTLVVNMAAPANLTANAGLTGTVSLSWSASIGATSYHLKRAQVRGGPYVAIACPTSTTFTDTGLVNGATYYYVVSAAYSAGLNAGGESPDSNEASAVPQPLPAAPTNVTASPGNLSGTISLLWTQSTGRGLARNNIYRRTAAGSYSSTPTTQINATTGYLDHNLKSGVTYCYQVTVLKDAGESTKSVPEACSTAK